MRERLVIRARYEQLVMDRPDSALTYWDLLYDAVSEDPIAYEGRFVEARYGVYFSRSLNTVVRLEADARRRNGETASADSLDRMIEAHQIADGDFWTWIILRAMTRRNSGSKTG